MIIILTFWKHQKVQKSKVQKSKYWCLLSIRAYIIFCIFSPKNTPQKWLFFGYFLDRLADFLYLCIVNMKEKKMRPS